MDLSKLSESDLITELRNMGLHGGAIQDVLDFRRRGGKKIDHGDIVEKIDQMRVDADLQREEDAADNLAAAQEAAGGAEQLAVIQRAFHTTLTEDQAEQFGQDFASVFATKGVGEEAVDFIRESTGFETSAEFDDQFPLGDPATRGRDIDAIRADLNLPPMADVQNDNLVEPGTTASLQAQVEAGGFTWRGQDDKGNVIAFDPFTQRNVQLNVGPSGEIIFPTEPGDEDEDRVRREHIGNNDAGQRVETNDFGDVWIDGIQVPTGSQAANNALNQAGVNGPPGGGRGGSGRAASPFQSLGTDRDGFAVIFNPNTGLTHRGEQIGFAQIDPRETAAEEARRFNDQQQLREGEFVRDVLSGGRNFVTAALLTRGGQRRPGGATQADIIAGGLGVSNLAEAFSSLAGQPEAAAGGGGPAVTASGGGQPATGSAPAGSNVTSGEGAAATREQINAGLDATGRFTTGPATVAGGGTIAAGGSGRDQQGGVGLSFPAQTSPDGFTGEPIDDLGGFARAEAPPAVKSILGGEEVGFLSTPGATPLASPTTLANLSDAEKGALDTTLQLSEQRTFAEFEQESNQRFRPGGNRQAVRA